MSEVGSDKKLSDEDKKLKVAELKKRIKDDQSLVKFPYENEVCLKRYLGGASYDVDLALEKIKFFFELLVDSPQWSTKTEPLEHKELIERHIRIALPTTDREGRPLYIVKLGNCKPSKMDIHDVVAVDDIWFEYILINFSAEKGLCCIVDLKDFPWTGVKWLTPQNIKAGLKKLNGLPFKDYIFHVVNESMAIHTIIKIIWPFLPENIKNMVKFHFSDREAFFKFVDPENLPIEYGGSDLNIDYSEILQKLFDKNEEIAESFKVSRTLEISE